MAGSGNRAATESYWSLARSPLHCLVFLLPLLALYELGMYYWGHTQPQLRNGADHWMRMWLEQQGWDAPWVLPGLVIGSLLTWQIVGGFSWEIRADTLVGMAAESLLFACLLLLWGHLQDVLFQKYARLSLLAWPSEVSADSIMGRTISFVGAGIYEEVLFRLLALPISIVLLRILLVPEKSSTLGAILLTSLLFSGAHYIGDGGESFAWFTFLFRTLAGCLFAILFVLRGFGITVGSHAAYDILVGIVLRSE